MESTRSNPFLLNHHHQYAASSSSANDWNSSPYQYPIGGGGGERARGPHPLPPPPCLYGGGGEGGSHNPDPHLMCLKLGKRHYFGDGACHVGERGKKPYYEVGGGAHSGVTVAAAPLSSAVARCQVDGCNAALVNAKEYHRRHKVCQMHSKAPRVVVLGLEQRFCQQCSRFHAVGEFDDTKRSCRRRLAGHNERRRKTSQDQSTPRNQPHPVNRKMMTYGGRHPVEFAESSNGCALSLLSSKKDSPSWISSPDLPAMCSAALRELIAENRAAILAQQLSLPHPPPPHHHHHHHQQHQHHQLQPQYQQQMGAAGSHLTLDLMQAPTSEFGFLSVRGRAKEDEDDDEGCPNLWGNSFRGTHAV